MKVTTHQLITALDQFQKLEVVIEFLELDLLYGAKRSASQVRRELQDAKQLQANFFGLIKLAERQGVPAPTKEQVNYYLEMKGN